MKINIAKPFLDENEARAVGEVLASGWVSQGPRCAAFERAVADAVAVRHARAVNSGTGALHLVLLACGIGPGDEVIVPAFTCVATVNPLEFISARPVLADIDLCTFALNPDAVLRAITPRTKAIVLVHLFGLGGPVEELARHAEQRGITLIEDAALSLGARVNGRAVGSFGKAAFLSFHPRKMITTGEGGMVLTDCDAVADAVSVLRNYGASVNALERHTRDLFDLPTYDRAGFNFKMTDIQAAVGTEQMKKLPRMIEARREIAHRYDAGLRGLDWLRLPEEPAQHLHVYQSYVCLLTPRASGDYEQLAVMQRKLFRHLADRGIAAVQGAQSMPTTAYYQRKYGWCSEQFPAALTADRGSVCLPIYPGLSAAEQEGVVEAVRCFVPA